MGDHLLQTPGPAARERFSLWAKALGRNGRVPEMLLCGDPAPRQVRTRHSSPQSTAPHPGPQLLLGERLSKKMYSGWHLLRIWSIQNYCLINTTTTEKHQEKLAKRVRRALFFPRFCTLFTTDPFWSAGAWTRDLLSSLPASAILTPSFLRFWPSLYQKLLWLKRISLKETYIC